MRELFKKPAVTLCDRRKNDKPDDDSPSSVATKIRRFSSRASVSGSTMKCSGGRPLESSHCSRQSASSALLRARSIGHSVTTTPLFRARLSCARKRSVMGDIVGPKRRMPGRLGAEQKFGVPGIFGEQRFEPRLGGKVTDRLAFTFCRRLELCHRLGRALLFATGRTDNDANALRRHIPTTASPMRENQRSMPGLTI